MLELYLITTGISFGISYLSARAYSDFLKRKNCVSTGISDLNYEFKFKLLSLVFKSLIPGYNIYTAIETLWNGTKDFNSSLEEGLKNGTIRRMTDEEIKELEEEKAVNKNSNVEVHEAYIKPYEQMTNEEKLAFLEREKELLLKEKENIEQKPIQYKIEKK